ncbi:MAG: hypothetical protein OEW12_08310, partial [Deltaproteobacteria bacterium]|nr:hypothetical protein [Deltaproteobacteria bacterium]
MDPFSEPTALPPWEPPGFDSEEGLAAAQEYFYNTHATNARMIAEGRQAKGFMKSYLRKKLEKSIGEDFKMYTGTDLGAEGGEVESLGIRGELNHMLETVYRKINPYDPISSPIQEDMAILAHPFGALETCFCMVNYYTSLLKKYATLAGNRRKVLKSVLEEELFKWVWRMVNGFFLSKDPSKLNFHNVIHSGGLEYIPLEKQRLSTPEKLMDIGQFLLGKAMSESHLRFPILFYFETYLYYLQYIVLCASNDNYAEAVLKKLAARKPEDPVSDLLEATEYLLEMKGNSGEGFGDVLANEAHDMEKFIPPPEIEFLSQFRVFSQESVMSSLRRFIPVPSNNPSEPPKNLAVLLLALRALPFASRAMVLEKIPGPFLSMILNRLSHAGDDDACHQLANHVREEIEVRKKRGETYSLPTFMRGGKTVVTTSRPAPVQAAPSVPGQDHFLDLAKRQAELAMGKPGGAVAQPGGGGNPAGGGQPAAPPDQSAGQPGGGGASGGVATEVGTGKPLMERRHDGPIPPGDKLMLERVIVDWKVQITGLQVTSISPADMDFLVGPDPRFIGPLVLFAIQTSQVFQ